MTVVLVLMFSASSNSAASCVCVSGGTRYKRKGLKSQAALRDEILLQT